MTATTFATIVPDEIMIQFLTDEPTNAARIYRARELVEAGHVERSNFPGLWLVRSATNENGSYRVTNGLCNCPDAARVGNQNCKHAISTRIFRAVERLDAEQNDPTPDPDDTYYCVLCEEPIPAAEVVETAHGFMHERCAASEPPPDEDTPRCPLHGDEECDWGCPGPSLDPRTVAPDADARYILTGKGWLMLVRQDRPLPALCRRCQNEDSLPRRPDGWGFRCVSDETFGGDAA